MRFEKYTAGLLLLCFSVFLGHNFVPHYHHSELNCSPPSAASPFEHSHQKSHERQNDADANATNHSAQCHAFNDVVLEKFSPTGYDPLTVQLLYPVMPCQVLVPDVALLLLNSPFTTHKQSGGPQSQKGTRSLRAPPYTV
jgi:hypothetical protein